MSCKLILSDCELELTLDADDLDLRMKGDTLDGDTLLSDRRWQRKKFHIEKKVNDLLQDGYVDPIRVQAAVELLWTYHRPGKLSANRKQDRLRKAARKSDLAAAEARHLMYAEPLSKTDCTRYLRSVLNFVRRDDRDEIVKELYLI